MSQAPNIQKQSTGLDFTSTIRNDTYEFIKPEQFDLTDRAILITGASKGLGGCAEGRPQGAQNLVAQA
jgi:hypothetical protein